MSKIFFNKRISDEISNTIINIINSFLNDDKDSCFTGKIEVKPYNELKLENENSNIETIYLSSRLLISLTKTKTHLDKE